MSTTNKTLLGILVFLLIAGIAWGLWAWLGKSEDEAVNTNTNTVEVTTETSDEAEEEEEEEKEPVEIYEHALAQDLSNWDIETQTFPSLSEEGMVRTWYVADPDDEDIVYFTADKFDSETEENFIGVYKFNTSTQEWERLYKGTYGAGDFTFGGFDSAQPPTFYPIGFVRGEDGVEKLILMVSPMEIGGTMCQDIYGWTELEEGSYAGWGHATIAMPIENPYSLETFTLPQEVIDAAKARDAECLETLDSELDS